MNKKYEMDLKSMLNDGFDLYWIPDSYIARKVESISKHKDEPSLCAFFNDGRYVALYNVDVNDFSVVKSLGEVCE